MDDDRIERSLRAGPLDEPSYLDVVDALGLRRRARPARMRMSLDRVGTVVAAALLVALVALVGPLIRTGPATSPHDLLAEVMASGRIRIVVTNGSPQVFVPGSGYAGFDLDVATAIGDRLGVRAEITLADRSEIEPGHWQGRWDLAIDSAASTPERLATLSLGAGYSARPGGVLVAESAAVTKLADLAGGTACVVRGGLAERWLGGGLQLIGGTVEPVPSNIDVTTRAAPAECQSAVAAGEAVAFVVDSTVDLPSIPARLALLSKAPFVAVAAGAVDPSRDGSGTLLARVDQVVADLRADGVLSSLSERRFAGQDLSILPVP